jgi:asparagine synthase (glutamine-hydrolysing)
MTALAAVVTGDARPAAGEVRRLLDAAAHRGAQAPVTWSSGPATIGHRASVARNGTPHTPFATGCSGNAIVFDGRLDNGDELFRAVGCDPRLSDAALVLAAYAKWGAQTPAHLLGDFAFAIWDAREQHLFCARDVFGQRPLFYAQGSSTIAVASEPQQLLAHPDLPAIVNEGAIAEYLTGSPMSMGETLWAGVRRLPPAHFLVAGASGVRCGRYWDFDPDARLEYPRPDEYAEQFASLFRTAIECRTRGAAAVGVFLSGGLDSSSIAGVAQGLARAGGGAPIRAFSLVFPGLPVDETPYIDAVAAQWNLPSVKLEARSATREEMEAYVERYQDVPTYPNGSVLDPLRRRAAAEVDIVLTGYGGDDWFTGSPLHTADLLREWRLVAAAKQYLHDVALPRGGYSAAGLLRTAIGPLLSPAARAVLRPLAGTRPRTYDWIRPEFAARVSLRERVRPPAPRRCRSHVQSAIRMLANSAQQVMGDELEDRAAAAASLEQRHPFNDRRLAEFAFALPESQRWSGGETKVVMRRALHAVLPPSVRRRNDKAEFTSTLVSALDVLGGRAFLSRLRCAEAGWVDAGAIRRMYDDMVGLYRRGDESYIPLADAVWSVAAVELWLLRR